MVYPDFENNRQELSRIDKILSPVATDTATYRILSASITGYASPEDTYKHNMVLSEQRAGGMRDYLHGRYGLLAEKSRPRARARTGRVCAKRSDGAT